MEDYTILKELAIQKNVLLTTTSNEVIAHEEHIEKTKKVFVKLFLGEDTDNNVDPASQEASDPIVPDPIIPTPIPDDPVVEPTVAWDNGVEGVYPVAIAPVADPEGYVRFADPSNNYIVFLKQESTTPVTFDNMPTDVVLPSVSLIAAMANYNIKRNVIGSYFQDGTPASSDLWPAEQLVYHWTRECLEAMATNNGEAGANIVDKVWALEWTKETGLTSRITTDSRPYNGMPYFSLYTGV